MKLLLDTHALIWWSLDDTRLSRPAADAIADTANEVAVSAVSAMEIATKYRLRKLPELRMRPIDLLETVRRSRFRILDVTVEHALKAGDLESDHRDPWDRLLAAQAVAETLTIVTRDPFFAGFGCSALW